MKRIKVLSRVLKNIGKYRFLLFLSAALSVFIVLLTLYFPILIGQTIDLLTGKGTVDFNAVFALLLKGGIAVGLTSLFWWVQGIINHKITYNCVRDIRNEAFAHIQELPFSYLDSHSVGDTVSRLIGDIDQFSDGLLLGFSGLFTSVLTIIGTLIFMLSINVGIALVVVVLTPLSMIVASFIANRTHKLFVKQSSTRGEQTSFIDEVIANQKVVSAFAAEQHHKDRFNNINDQLEKISLSAVFYSSLTNPTTRFVNSLVYAAVALFGAISAINGGITVGYLASVLSYANQYTKPFNEISGVLAELQNALACAQRVFNLIDQPGQSSDADLPSLGEAKGDVKLNNVSFSYTPEKELIKDFCLDVKQGQRIAIVGPTGCGKTTLINLLVRFYDVDSGEILLDNKNIKQITRASLRKNFGMVLQDSHLKSGTVAENVAYSKRDATRQEIIEACKAAHAHSFIKRLPNGYDTVLGEDGGSLSVGQKQLLCIARIMLNLPPIMILDEATSSIDTRTELKIQKSFNEMMKGRTSFIVAHRLATIKEADIILVMNNGNVIEQGTHKELLAKNGFYAKLYNSQFDGED